VDVAHSQRRCILAALAGLALGAAAGQAQDLPRQNTLPASLSAAQFWQLVSEFSEPGGNFPSDNFTSNEMAIGQVASDLVSAGLRGGVYIGVGPEQNFTYIAALQPRVAFVVDIRRQAIMQHLMYKAVFELSATRADFMARLFSKPTQTVSSADSSIRSLWDVFIPLAPDSTLYAANLASIYRQLVDVRGFTLSDTDSASIRYVYSAFHRIGPVISYRGMTQASMASPAQANFVTLTAVADTAGVERSFLATESNYQLVRDMHLRNVIVPVVGDFGGNKALRMIGDWIRSRGAMLTAFYTSNVEQYLFRPNDTWRQFYANVGFMPVDSSSVFIRPGLGSGPTGAMLTYTVNVRTFSSGGVVQVRPPAQVTLPAAGSVATDSTRGSLAGVVRDNATGNGLAQVSVTVPGSGVTAITDSAGKYHLAGVPPGTFTLSARRVGYARIDIPAVVVNRGVTTEVNINLPLIPLALQGGVAAPGGGYSMSVNIPGAGGPSTALCPIAAFLAAVNAGRVQAFGDAISCVR
jgi:hypothetical protein